MYRYIIIIVRKTTVVRQCLHILNVLGKVLGYEEYILLAILFVRKWTVCETKELSKPASKCCLIANFGRSLPSLIIEQTPTSFLTMCSFERYLSFVSPWYIDHLN